MGGVIRKPLEIDIVYYNGAYILNWCSRDNHGNIIGNTKAFRTYVKAVIKIAEINGGSTNV